MALKRLTHWLRSLNPYDPATLQRDGLKPIQIEEAAIKRKTLWFIIAVFTAFMVWAVWAPLDAGVLVPGTVVVKGNRKAVQHPSGGVVDEINVSEGARVKQGDILLRLNPLNIDAGLSATELDYINALTTLSRLLSERAHRTSIDWGTQIHAFKGDPRLVQAMRLQTEVFNSRTAELRGQQQIIDEQIVGTQAQLSGLDEALKERKHQLTMVNEEARDMAALAADGFIPRNMAYQAERGRSDMVAGIATSLSQQASTQANLAAQRLQLIQLLSAYHKDLDTQISEVQKNQQALAAKVEALRHERNLIEVRSPASGIVVGLKAHTIGGVISGGSVLMEIVPLEGRLVVDAQVPSHYIDKVRVGMNVDLRFSAFNMNTTPVIYGKVKQVGADLITAAPTSQAASIATSDVASSYYLAQIETTDEQTKLLGDKLIQAGMPVEVIIKSGERNFLSFVLKPITDRFVRAFIGD